VGRVKGGMSDVCFVGAVAWLEAWRESSVVHVVIENSRL
jgi:hypothetical protein